MESLKALENIKKMFVGSPIDLTQQFDVIKKDLEILEILKELMFYVPSHYENQANWGNEYISMSYIDKTWTNQEIYEKVKQWCFENKIRGTKEK